MPYHQYSAVRLHPRISHRAIMARPGILNPLSQNQAMTLYLRTGLRMSSAIVAVGIALLGVMFVGLWFVTNIF